MLDLRLEEPTLGSLQLDRTQGIHVHSVDFGSAAPREVVDPRTDADGEDDTTLLRGGRAVTINATVGPVGGRSRADTVDLLAAYMDPSRRSYLYFSRDGQAERRIRLRGMEGKAPVQSPTFTAVHLAWRAPDGIMEAAALSTVSVDAAVDVEPGRSYPLTYPRSYPDSPSLGVVELTNAGLVAADPVLLLHGPCVDPRIENQTMRQVLVFTGVTLAAGQWLEVDVAARTVRLNGLSGQSRLRNLDYSVSDWWRLAPGVNRLRYYPATFELGAAAEIRWRHAWL